MGLEAPDKWNQCLDPTSGQVYYINTETNESTWDRPDDLPEQITAAWQQFWDPDQSLPYWYSTATGATTWDKPKDDNMVNRAWARGDIDRQARSSGVGSASGDVGVESSGDRQRSHREAPVHMLKDAIVAGLPKALPAPKIPMPISFKDSPKLQPPIQVLAGHRGGMTAGRAVESDGFPSTMQRPPNETTATASSDHDDVHVPSSPDQARVSSFLQQQMRRRSKRVASASHSLSTSQPDIVAEITCKLSATPQAQTTYPAMNLTTGNGPAQETLHNEPTMFPPPPSITLRPVSSAGNSSTTQNMVHAFEVAPVDAVKALPPNNSHPYLRRASSSMQQEPLPTRVVTPVSVKRCSVHVPTVLRKASPTIQPPPATERVSKPPGESKLPADRSVTSTKESRQIDQVISEIVSSERSYVASLQLLVDVFIQRIATDPSLSALMGDARVAMFFSNAEQVASLNTTMLAELEQIIVKRKGVAMLGDMFIRYVKLFPVYTQYARCYGQACIVLLEKNDALETVFKDLASDQNAGGQSIFSLGIMPIQRLPRYCLLLRELQRNLPESIAEVDDALIQVESAASAINEAIRDRELRDDMLKAASASRQGAELLKTGHHLLKTGQLSKIDRKGNLKRHTFMLFADQLRYGNRSISLEGCTINRDSFQFAKRGLHGWVVQTPSKSFMVCADTEAIANEWISAIEDECIRWRGLSSSPISVAPVKTRGEFCSVCASRFTMRLRQRSCDLCGRPICQNCCAKIRRNGSKMFRACHFCRLPSDDEVDDAVSASSTMNDGGNTYTGDEERMVTWPAASRHSRMSTATSPLAEVRNHLATALEELKEKVVLVDGTTFEAGSVSLTTPATPTSNSHLQLSPLNALRRLTTPSRKHIDHLASRIGDAWSRSTSSTDTSDVGTSVRRADQVHTDLLADVRGWMSQHRRKTTSNLGGSASLQPLRTRAGSSPIPASETSIQWAMSTIDDGRRRLCELETTYLQQLDEVDRIFAKPLLEDMTCAALPSSVAIVFDTIQNLRTIHAKLSSSLKEGSDLLQTLLMFSELARRPYIVYAKHYGEAVSALGVGDLRNRVNLCAKTAGIATSGDATMTLQKHLTRPMQRLPLYISFAERLKILTQNQQPPTSTAGTEFDSISKAHFNFQDAWKRMSEIVEMRANFETLKSVEAMFDAGGSSSLHLATPSRIFIRWSMLNKYDRRGRIEHLAFHLFSDVLLYSEKVAAGFKLRREIPLPQCQLIRDETKEQYPNAFQLCVIGSTKSLVIGTSSEKERREWIEMINNCIARLQIRRKQSIDADERKNASMGLMSPSINVTPASPDDGQLRTEIATWNEAETWPDVGSYNEDTSMSSPLKYSMFFEDGADSIVMQHHRKQNSSTDSAIKRSSSIETNTVEQTDHNDPGLVRRRLESHPQEVESLWTLYLTDQGDEYFHDEVSGRTTWTKPSKFSSVACASDDSYHA